MNRSGLAEIGLGVAIVLGLAGAWRLQQAIDQDKDALHVEHDDLTLRSGSTVKKLSLEYAPLMGAIYWTRAVQYYGNKHRMHDQNLELLWPMLDVATTLDPQLIVAYRFGSIFLSDAPPRGAGQPDLAVKLLERGIKANPEYWRFYQDLGNVYYFDKKDYAKATQAYLTGGNFPGAPPWMKAMAAKIAAEGESLETSYYLWAQVLQEASDPQIRQNAESHMRLLKAEMDCRELNRLADMFVNQTGRRAGSLQELVQAGLLQGIPMDPEGYPYGLDQGGRAIVNPRSPIYKEKQAQQK
jgi:tetratricopeptide (TPR) repeat protein